MEKILSMISDSGVWGYVLTFLLGLAPVAAFVARYKKVAIELSELVHVTASAFQDGKIDDQEIARIWKEGKDVKKTIDELKELK